MAQVAQTNVADVAERNPAARGRCIIHMVWSHLLFAHWPMPPASIARLLPDGVELDTFDSQAWLGIVPFRMSGVRAAGLPPVPGTHAFAELNVRTYVKAGGRSGVWFFSLDADSQLAVHVARATWNLPYFHARMDAREADGVVHYQSTRIHRFAPPARFVADYAPDGPATTTVAGTLDHFLTSRYSLFCADRRGRIYRGDIHHAPWQLHPATARFSRLEMTEQFGLKLPDIAPLLHYSRRLEAVAWPIRRIS